jgi:hypothetical protein
MGEVPIVDIRQFPARILRRLADAYKGFLKAHGQDRAALDAVVLDALSLPSTYADTLRVALGRMQHLSEAILEPIAVEASEGHMWPEELRLL